MRPGAGFLLAATGRPIPQVTMEQMRRVDRLMIEDFGVTLLQMMENAGRALAVLALAELREKTEDAGVLVVAGSGNNGGGGLAAARHLANWGVSTVAVSPSGPESGAPAHQWNALLASGVTVYQGARGQELISENHSALIVDSLIGYGLEGETRPEARRWIQLMNASATPLISLDVPSGLDSSTGRPRPESIRASATLTLALPKTGLLEETARAACGQLYLADIGVPPSLYKRMGIDISTPIFTGRPYELLAYQPAE